MGDNTVVNVSIWPDCNPDKVLELLKLPTVLGDINGKEKKKVFPSSYPKTWSLYSEQQKNKAINFFNTLTSTDKDDILNKAKQLSLTSAAEEHQRNIRVTKHDLARLIMLRKDPGSQMAWSRTQAVNHSRRDLDARKSTGAPSLEPNVSLAESLNGWQQLANRFNDYDGFRPQNVTVLYVNNEDGHPVPMEPRQPANDQCAVLFGVCKMIDPCCVKRSDIIRDSGWIKEQWLGLRALMNPVLDSFNRSGQFSNHSDAEVEWFSEHEQKRWLYHANNKNRASPDVIAYAYAALEKSDFQAMSRKLEEGSGIDSSIATDSSVVGDRGRERRKRQKRVAIDLTENDESPATTSIAEIAQLDVQLQARDRALMFLAKESDNDDLRKKAVDELEKIAFSNYSKPPMHPRSTPVHSNMTSRTSLNFTPSGVDNDCNISFISSEDVDDDNNNNVDDD
jgi:hypothetical protein